MPELWSIDGKTHFGFISAQPVCGVDFCDSCGDCLSCFGGDWCPNGDHTWIVYEDNLTKFLEEHDNATVEFRKESKQDAE